MALDDANGKVFVGRDKEINDILGRLKQNNSTRTLLVGESGIGKSALLDEIYRRLTNDNGGQEDQENVAFVGYYDKSSSLAAPSQSSIEPFNIVLANLIKEAKRSQQLDERIDSTINRIQRAIMGFAKEEGAKMAEAIIQDVAKKAGLEETFKVAKGFWSRFQKEKSSLMLAEETVSKNRDQAMKAYLDIFRALAKDFNKRRFVLIFDQFEHVGKSSTDFFLNFVKSIMPQDRFHIIVSFRTDDITWNDPSVRNAYEELEQKLIYDLDTDKMSLEGLSPEDIGKWIKTVQGRSPPLMPDLLRIRENSAGLPVLLNEWIISHKKLNYKEIRRNKLCDHIIRLQKGLVDKDLVRLYKMSILLQPLRYEGLARYLGTEEQAMNVDDVRPLITHLSEHRIFDPQLNWFKHDLVKNCFEDKLDPEERRSYHNRAAEFFHGLAQQKEPERKTVEAEKLNDDTTNVTIEQGRNDIYFIAISTAYHLHMAGGKNYEKSFTYNKHLGGYASNIGDLDVAERCYKRAIADAEYLERIEDKMQCLYEMTGNVYSVWGRNNEALTNYQLLLEYYDSINNTEMRGRLLNDMATMLCKKLDYDQAMKLFNESLKISRQIGDRRSTARTLHNMAMIHDKKRDYDQAMKLYNESLEISRQIGDQSMTATTLNCMGMIYARKEDHDQAMKLYNESLEISRQIGDQQGETLNSLSMKLIEMKIGNEAYQKLMEKSEKH